MLELAEIVTAILTAAIVGAAATFYTQRAGLSDVQARVASIERQVNSAEKTIAEAMKTFLQEAAELRKAVNRLTESVTKHGVYVDGMESIYERIRTLENEMATVKARIR